MKRAAGVVLFALLASPLGAQVPAGGEFQVNTYTTHDQRSPAVAMHRDGSFVVVWYSIGQDNPDGTGVFAQRFDATGSRLGGEFQVNTYTTRLQSYLEGHDVALDDAGNFVIVWWAEHLPDEQLRGIFGQRFDASGNRVGGEFHVNTFTNYQQAQFKHGPRVALAPGGSFVVVWDSVAQDGDNYGVFARRYDAMGAAIGAEFQVNTYTTNRQLGSDVAMDRSGNFVVVWTGYLTGPFPNHRFDVFGQRFDAGGARVGAEFLVNSYTTWDQGYLDTAGPDVAMADDGRFIVTWGTALQQPTLRGQRFAASGDRVGDEFAVNAPTTFTSAGVTSVTADALGNFTVSWNQHDGVFGGVWARRWSGSGTPRSGDFRVNSYTTGQQYFSSLASDDVGNFVVAWSSDRQDGHYYGIFAQRFGGLRPQALEADPGGNRVIEPGETAVVKPAWHNTNGAALTFGGSLAGLTGPPGASYTITDATALYGTVANGALATCADCYSVNVSGARPATHWDASAVETITPDTLGQQKQWVLHLGASFADVAVTSPFYPFVETLLHREVTAGCTATTYCPLSVTTREQMAVFVLRAKEGNTYQPPPCGTPVFADVPPISPFCRWIEELARRGVVGGCGGSNYCPAADVTREQMAVFVLRTLDPTLDPPACTTPVFADMPASNPFCRWVEELARRGVVSGCGGGNYCPTEGVTREQMGVFLGVTFGLMLYGP